jgi:AcrR family transcriptional regulator
MSKDRRQDIVNAAIDLFARKGFRGTTTRNLATHAGVNEAIIFRHFKTKEELYTAILERKVGESREAQCKEFERLAETRDDRLVFETLGRTFMKKHEEDSTFMRLLLFSALEGHALSEMFLASVADRDPVARYIQLRIDEGAFRPIEPHLAARALFGMFASFVQWQELFGQKKSRPYDRDEVVQTFVSIFLSGIKR